LDLYLLLFIVYELLRFLYMDYDIYFDIKSDVREDLGLSCCYF
jgi:hypothetical protein